MLKSLSLTRFTVFDHVALSFSPGVNVFVGANATGKTHVLKAAYSVLRTRHSLEYDGVTTPQEQAKELEVRLSRKLRAVFRPEHGYLKRLVRRPRSRGLTLVELESTWGPVGFSLSPAGELRAKQLPGPPQKTPTAVYIPTREVLSIYPGFYAAYRNRELAFDETYADICFALSAAPLRGEGELGEAAAELMRPLREAIGVEVSLDGEQFYLTSRQEGTVEACLAAEGVRKLASVMQLIANGMLRKDVVLFWDEPESGLNPRLARIAADFLLRLAAGGVQVLVATHDYLLTNELSLSAEYRNAAAGDAPVRFFAFSRGDSGAVEVQPGDTLADLEHNPIMEEFEALYDRERRLFYETDQTR